VVTVCASLVTARAASRHTTAARLRRAFFQEFIAFFSRI
jgi:hypothetical protein